jgi:hypothetical protein
MKHVLVVLVMSSTIGLAACDRQPVVSNPPPVVVTVPGPAGPAGETGATGATGQQGYTGNQGNTGSQGEQGYTGNTGSPGEAGKTGGVTNVIVIPPAATPTN